MERKILIVEDSEQDRKIMKRFLNKAGFNNIHFAEIGKEGLRKVEAEKPDLLITDTMLPDTNGFEICRQARELAGKDLKIVITTGSIDAVDAVKAKEVGADDYCAKTSDCLPLLEAVTNLLKTVRENGR